MYICGLIPWNLAELAEAVPIGAESLVSVEVTVSKSQINLSRYAHIELFFSPQTLFD